MINLPKRIIGLTGMSGAGKTTVCDVFRAQGYAVVNCDLVARRVLGKNSLCVSALVARFPEKIVTDGELDRKKTASVIFGDERLKALYERIVFPYISYAVFAEMLAARDNPKGVLLDAPTLFESGLNVVCGVVISVVADRGLVLERIKQRDSLTEAEAENRLNAQKNAEYYAKKSDYTVYNNHDINYTKAQILELLEKLDTWGKDGN